MTDATGNRTREIEKAGHSGSQERGAAILVPGYSATDPRARDTLVQACVDLMIRRAWERGVTPARIASELSIPLSTVKDASAEAARHLRLIREPETLIEWCVNEARKVLETSGEPMVKLAAVKTILEQYRAHGAKGSPAPRVGTELPREARVALLTESLQDPDDELREALDASKESLLRYFNENRTPHP